MGKALTFNRSRPDRDAAPDPRPHQLLAIRKLRVKGHVHRVLALVVVELVN